MPEGTIKKLVSDRGFGFITADRGDIFFHHSACVDVRFEDLQIGEAVQYDVDQGDGGRSGKGPRAINVRRA